MERFVMKSKRSKTVFEAGHMFDQSKMLLFQTRWGWFVPIDVPDKGKVLICMVGGGKVAGNEGSQSKLERGKEEGQENTELDG